MRPWWSSPLLTSLRYNSLLLTILNVAMPVVARRWSVQIDPVAVFKFCVLHFFGVILNSLN